MIKAIIFDYDGTLAYTLDAQVGYYQRVLPLFGWRKPSAQEIRDTYHMTNIERVKLLTGETSEDKIREAFATKEAKDFPYDMIRVADGAERVLKELQSGFKFAIATSASALYVNTFLALSGLKGFFAAMACIGEYKNPKPSPDCLFLAAERLGLKPEECIYVGDQEIDVATGRAAGMKVILVAKQSRGNEDVRINALSELPFAIAKLQASTKTRTKGSS